MVPLPESAEVSITAAYPLDVLMILFNILFSANSIMFYKKEVFYYWLNFDNEKKWMIGWIAVTWSWHLLIVAGKEINGIVWYIL